MYGLVLADDLVLLVHVLGADQRPLVPVDRLLPRAARQPACRTPGDLIVTTLGGLTMLVGLVILVESAGTSSISGILAEPPSGTVVTWRSS